MYIRDDIIPAELNFNYEINKKIRRSFFSYVISTFIRFNRH